MSRIKFIHTTWILILVFMLCGCYKEQHFSMPEGNGGQLVTRDTLPFPFDPDRQAGEYLIRNGEVDFSRVVTLGYTDFQPTIGADSLSWYFPQDKSYYGCRAHANFYALSDADHFGGNKYSFEGNDFFTKVFMEIGQGKKWYFYAKMSLTYLNNTRCYFTYGGNDGWSKRHMAGIDWGLGYPSFFAYVNGAKLTSQLPACTEEIIPGDPFEIEIVCVDAFVYCKVNGLTLWYYNLPADAHSHPIQFRPWTNAVQFYDVYIEGDYHEMDVVAHQHEKSVSNQQEYTTVQVPALTKASNGDILLVAEGRVNNYVQTSNLQAKRPNATDIVLKRSTDGGENWSGLTTIVGGDGSVNMKPCLVTDAEGTVHLLYTLDLYKYQTGDNEIFSISSSDNGNTWTAPQKITAAPENYVLSTTAGHGIQTKSGKLIMPALAVYGRQKSVAVLYSSDNGSTWQAGEAVPGLTNAANANVVELPDNRLMLVIGHESSSGTRKISYSNDGGIHWSEPENSKIRSGSAGHKFQGATLITADGRLVHVTPGELQKGSEYSFAVAEQPDNQKEMYIYKAPDFGSGLNITVSGDLGNSWSVPESLLNQQTYTDYKFLTGSADMLLLDNTVLCVSEGGAVVPYEGLVSFKKAL